MQAATFGLIGLLGITVGCGPKVSSIIELEAFERAGPILPEVDPSRLVVAKRYSGPYRVVAGDLLEVRMPAVLRAAISETAAEAYERVEPYLARVESTGDISLPMAGRLPVAGKTFGEIDQIIANAYYPKYLRLRPSVVTRAMEYRTVTVAVVGGVMKPGVYELRSDELSIAALLMKAGGFAKEGASVIRIRKLGEQETEPVILPVKEMNIPFADVALSGGENVEVQQIDLQVLTVIGLVNKPGAFPYPPNVEYSLLQGIGLAGGVDQVAGPQHATVYRRGADGDVVSAVFRFSDKKLTGGAALKVRPGDVISVDETPLTQARKTLAQVFRVVIGAQMVTSINAGGTQN